MSTSILKKTTRNPIKFPVNINNLNDSQKAQLKSLRQNIVTEAFAFSPELFAKEGMDLANVSMYNATNAVMNMLLEQSQQDDPIMDEDEITKGIYRMETLLESAIDTHFDMFELYVLRNTFALRDELIPYIELSHQTELDENVRGLDVEAMNEYTEELRLFEEELQKQRELACADEFIKRKLESVQKRAQEFGYMRGAEPISSSTQILISQLPLLQESLSTLLNTPTPFKSKTSVEKADAGPWGSTRAAYVNWAATSKVDALPTELKEFGVSGTSGQGLSDELVHSQASGDGEAAINLIAALSAN